MTNMEFATRLVSSTLFGTLIGIERQWHHKNAGIKTNTLVAVGSTAFGLISELGFGPTTNPVQVASGVVSGIGFIGAWRHHAEGKQRARNQFRRDTLGYGKHGARHRGRVLSLRMDDSASCSGDSILCPLACQLD